MSETLVFSSPLTAYFLPAVISALAALVAWQGYRRLREEALWQATWAFILVAVIQAVLLAEGNLGGATPGPLLRVLECVSAALIGWPFFGRARHLFLVCSLSLCGMLGAFTLSLWQLTGAETAWAAPAWLLSSAAIYGAVAVSLWTCREFPLTFLAAFALLTLGSVAGATGWSHVTLVLRLVAFPLALVALMQLATRDLESAKAELVSFSEYSLRQTQQLLTLLRASTAFLTRTELTAILREAVEGVAVGVGADNALIALLDITPKPGLRIQAIYPPTPQLNSAPIPLLAQPAIADAVQNSQQVVLAPSQRGVHALAALMGCDAGPAIVQPLLCQKHMLGIIVALNGRTQRVFTEGEQHVLEAFGAQVAAASENALLDRLIESQTRELAELLSAREEEASRRAAILESIADGVIVFDYRGQVMVANPAARALLNLDGANVVGRNMREIMDGQLQPDDYVLIRSRIEGEQPLPPGFRVAWGSKTVALSVAPVRLTSAEQHGAVMVLRDITHDAEVDQLKSEFVTVVSHELRSPFAALDFSMQLIQKYGLDNLLPEQREQLRQLDDGLKRAQTMINNLITFAAFLSKQGRLRITLVDMGQITLNMAGTLEPMALTRDIKMTLQISDGLPPVYGDHDRLFEAMYHLTHNACKFNRPGGTVKIACRAAPEAVIFEVSDTGVGIPPDKLPEMWKDFTQLADPLRRGVEGLGLGLPLVRYVVKAHGGQVWARSQPGQGSVFGFSIPLAGRAA